MVIKPECEYSVIDRYVREPFTHGEKHMLNGTENNRDENGPTHSITIQTDQNTLVKSRQVSPSPPAIILEKYLC